MYSSIDYPFLDVPVRDCVLKVPTSAVSAYKGEEIWKDFIIQAGGILVYPKSSNLEYGFVNGNELYEGKNTATVEAIANEGYQFVNWTKEGVIVSTANPYRFTVTEDTELVANFFNEGENPETYEVNISVNNEEYGTATGSGTYLENTTATVTAIAHNGYQFVNWTKDGVEISTDNPYGFTVTEDIELVANFEEKKQFLLFDSYTVTKWNNTFMLNLKKLAEFRFTPTACKWFKNGELIGEGFTYSAGNKIIDQLEAGAIYTFELTTSSHGILHSTDKVIDVQKSVLRVYPNPVPQGSKLTIEGTTQDMLVEVYNLNGVCISRIIAAGSVTELILAVPAGIYVVRTNNQEVKVIIQ